ncbi:hypothetical protein CA54_47520 [Symmachiella macrocystis]|uniref:Uncharacterized protein n=1 Tax=Symmachiella macrocystis TaxID=2527985 RepID=A0A5C6BC51_9PLAN|nr:hypothetical protein [Symmachiella macrocystis]TWU09510.1 hypothetical protein CA54_47520 [Symmachiella macrocystis]
MSARSTANFLTVMLMIMSAVWLMLGYLEPAVSREARNMVGYTNVSLSLGTVFFFWMAKREARTKPDNDAK